MFNSYVKLAVRNLRKNKLPSFINLAGLSIAIGCSIVIFLLSDFMLTGNRNHEHARQIFMLENVVEENGEQQVWGDAPVPLGPALEADFPQVERAARVADRGATVQYGEHVFREQVRFVDPAFLEMFTFPLKLGDSAALRAKDVVILSESMAEKYFGTNNPLGEQVILTFGKDRQETFRVGGVAEEFSLSASFGFGLLVPYDKLFDLEAEWDDWGALTSATFIQVRHPDDIDALAAQMERYQALHNAASTNREIAAFRFDPLLNIPFSAASVRGSISNGSSLGSIILLASLGLILLALACFNYMNIAIASAARRLKEIGIRKAAGGSRAQLIGQFLCENVVLCLLALLLGLVLAQTVFFPGFMRIIGEAGFSLTDFFDNPRLWIFFLSVLLVTGLGAGAYPAFYISRFQAVTIFRGQQKLAGNTPFIRTILAMQVGFSFVLVLFGVVVTLDGAYQRGIDWGYNQEQTLVVPLDEPAQYARLKDEFSRHPNVIQVAGSVHHVGRATAEAVIEVATKNYNVARLDVGPDYVETLRLRLREGRSFDPRLPTDREAVLVNESLVRHLGWQEAVGQQIRYGDVVYTVIGVIEDFHYAAFNTAIEPTLIRLAAEDTFAYLAARVQAGTALQTADDFQAVWKMVAPGTPYNGFFQDDVFDDYWQDRAKSRQIFTSIAFVALLLSCMGLFGLVSLNIARRMKELSIRKVLGASLRHLVHQISRELILVLLVATVVAVPASYLLLKALYDAAGGYHMPLGPTPFVITFGMILLTAMLTVATHVYKAATANPVVALRDE